MTAARLLAACCLAAASAEAGDRCRRLAATSADFDAPGPLPVRVR